MDLSAVFFWLWLYRSQHLELVHGLDWLNHRLDQVGEQRPSLAGGLAAAGKPGPHAVGFQVYEIW